MALLRHITNHHLLLVFFLLFHLVGEFVVLNYRVTGEFRCPFRVFPVVEETAGSGGYKMDVVVRVRADIPEAHHGANVVSVDGL
jgi:hypothetical protein